MRCRCNNLLGPDSDEHCDKCLQVIEEAEEERKERDRLRRKLAREGQKVAENCSYKAPPDS